MQHNNILTAIAHKNNSGEVPDTARAGCEIDFATDDQLERFSAAGFSYRERLGRWTLGASSALELPEQGHDGGFDLKLALWAKPPVAAGAARRQLQLKVNGELLHTQTVAGLTALHVTIPAAVVAAGQGRIRLDFLHPPPEGDGPPSQGEDTRALALFFQRLLLAPQAAPQTAASSPDATGLAAPADLATMPSRLGLGPGDEKLQILAAAEVGSPAELVGAPLTDPRLIAEHRDYQAPGATYAYAIRGASVWGNGMVRDSQGHLLQPPGCFPRYFASYAGAGAKPLPPVWAGAFGGPDAKALVLDQPVVSVMHPNVVYGHFLLEVLPRLFQFGILRDWGCRAPLILSDKLPGWVKALCALYEPPQRTVWYDHARHYVAAPAIILPSMMHTDHHFHPAFNQMVSDLLRRLPAPSRAQDLSAYRRLYVSRTGLPGTNRLQNESEVEALMQDMGFAILHPQTLPVHDQVQIYAQADVIVGEFSSALHNSMFMRPESGVVAINFFNSYQSAICRVRRQKIAYVPPSDGVFRHWQHSELARSFRVDLAQLRATTAMMLSAVG